MAEGLTEFSGDLSCIYRHHERIKLYYDKRTAGDLYGMYTELNNVIGDIIPEMSDKEFEAWEKDLQKLRNNLFVYQKNTNKTIELSFMYLIEDMFSKYMRMSKSKGMLQRNAPSLEELFT